MGVHAGTGILVGSVIFVALTIAAAFGISFYVR